MKSPKLFETKKLHYGAYLYKIVFYNELSTIFRTELQKRGTLSYAKERLEDYKSSYASGEPLYKYKFRSKILLSNKDFLEACDLYDLLITMNDYKVRVDPWGSIMIYSNNLDDLNKICDKIPAKELWKPSNKSAKLLKEMQNIIITDDPVSFAYKITLNRSKIGHTPQLAKWLVNNKDKSKVGSRALDMFAQDLYVDGLYFFVRDEKVLMLIEMMIGNKIRRVDKLIYKGDIDKY